MDIYYYKKTISDYNHISLCLETVQMNLSFQKVLYLGRNRVSKDGQ